MSTKNEIIKEESISFDLLCYNDTNIEELETYLIGTGYSQQTFEGKFFGAIITKQFPKKGAISPSFILNPEDYLIKINNVLMHKCYTKDELTEEFQQIFPIPF